MRCEYNFKHNIYIMKKKGSTSDYIEERNAELRERFFSQKGYEVNTYTTDHLLERAVKSGSSRFWVDPYRARDIISRYDRDPHSLDRMLPGRRAMYRELYARFAEIRHANPCASMIECVSRAILSPAPEFYLTFHTARQIIFPKRPSATPN